MEKLQSWQDVRFVRVALESPEVSGKDAFEGQFAVVAVEGK